MKRVLSIFVMVVLMCGISSCAFALEKEEIVISESEIDSLGYDLGFVLYYLSDFVGYDVDYVLNEEESKVKIMLVNYNVIVPYKVEGEDSIFIPDFDFNQVIEENDLYSYYPSAGWFDICLLNDDETHVESVEDFSDGMYKVVLSFSDGRDNLEFYMDLEEVLYIKEGTGVYDLDTYLICGEAFRQLYYETRK